MTNHRDLVSKSKDYKKVLQRKLNEYQKDFIVKLRRLRITYSKSYWSLLNMECDKSNTIKQKVAINVLFDHFKKLNNVDNNVDMVLPENVTE